MRTQGYKWARCANCGHATWYCYRNNCPVKETVCGACGKDHDGTCDVSDAVARKRASTEDRKCETCGGPVYGGMRFCSRECDEGRNKKVTLINYNPSGEYYAGVHRKGCSDLTKELKTANDHSTEDFASVEDAIKDWLDDLEELGFQREDVHVFACAKGL